MATFCRIYLECWSVSRRFGFSAIIIFLNQTAPFSLQEAHGIQVQDLWKLVVGLSILLMVPVVIGLQLAIWVLGTAAFIITTQMEVYFTSEEVLKFIALVVADMYGVTIVFGTVRFTLLLCTLDTIPMLT